MHILKKRDMSLIFGGELKTSARNTSVLDKRNSPERSADVAADVVTLV